MGLEGFHHIGGMRTDVPTALVLLIGTCSPGWETVSSPHIPAALLTRNLSSIKNSCALKRHPSLHLVRVWGQLLPFSFKKDKVCCFPWAFCKEQANSH